MEWIYYGSDVTQIRDIHRRFGTIPLKKYPLSPVLRHEFYFKYIKDMKVVRPLNYVPYIKEDAARVLSETYGWKAYGQKHFESRFTKFFEGFWLPERFGYDTRKVQYSSLILTGQMMRKEALEKLMAPAYDPETIDDQLKYIAAKLNITGDQLTSYLNAPKNTYKDYKNQENLILLGARVLHIIGAARSVKR